MGLGDMNPLIGGLSNSKSDNPLLKNLYQRQSSNDDLISVAQRSRPDKVKLSHFMLKKRLAESLDQVLKNGFSKHPSLKDNIHIGIMTDEQLSVEVISKEKALAAVSDTPKEEAKQLLDTNPVGYYQSSDFQLQTPDSEAHQSMKKDLESFFKKNAGLFEYLRENPENDINLEDLLQ